MTQVKHFKLTHCDDYGDAYDASQVYHNFSIKDDGGNDESTDDDYNSDDTYGDDGEEVAADVSL